MIACCWHLAPIHPPSPTPLPRLVALHPPVVNAPPAQEWVVIKTNNRGKRQKRVLGVDQSSVYNRKMDGNWGIKSVKRVRAAPPRSDCDRTAASTARRGPSTEAAGSSRPPFARARSRRPYPRAFDFECRSS